jgi:hypothetical protein
MYIVQLTIINCDALIFFGINDLSPLNILSMLFLQRKPENTRLNDPSTNLRLVKSQRVWDWWHDFNFLLLL